MTARRPLSISDTHVVTHVDLLQLIELEEAFAFPTAAGWKLPDWLANWEERIQGRLELQT